MSGGFFRGTSADQDTRFSNKQAKLLKSQKFPPELEYLVDVSKVKMDVIKPWIARRVTELLGFEDEVLINFINGLLEGKAVNGKQVQIQLTGFMEKNTGKFMKELWVLLLSAEKNASGVPQQFLDAKEEETRKKKEETNRIFNEIQKMKEKETKESEHEKQGNMDGGLDDRNSEESNKKAERGSDTRSGDDTGRGMANGFRGRKRLSKSPHSSDRLPSPCRERSKSRSISRSPRTRRQSVSPERGHSGSPRAHRRSISPEKVRRSPRRSITPTRRSFRKSISPSHRSHSGRRSSPRPRYRSPSPMRRRIRSPLRRRSPSPIRRRSPTPRLRRSPSPLRRRRSPSPLRRRRSPSPRRRRSPSPRRRRSPSPRRRRSPSPWRRRSPSPRRRRSPSPIHRRRRRSISSSRSRSPVQRRPQSPVRRRYESPVRRLPYPVRRKSPSPIISRTPSPVRRMFRPPAHAKSSPPLRRRSPVPAHRQSPSSSVSKSPSPASRSSASPSRSRSVSPVKMKSPGHHKSTRESSKERTRDQRPDEPPKLTRKQLISLSPQRDHSDRTRLGRKVPSVSLSPEKKYPSYLEPPRTRTSSVTENRSLSSTHESPHKRVGDRRTLEGNRSPRIKEPRARRGSPEIRGEPLQNFRDDEKKTERGTAMLSVGRNKESPDGPVSRRRQDTIDSKKRDTEMTSEALSVKEARTPEKSSLKGPLHGKILDTSNPADGRKSDEKITSYSKDAKDDGKSGTLVKSHKRLERRSPSVDSDSVSEGSDKQRARVFEKRKHRKSSRREAASDDSTSDSEVEDRKEVKRRKKEEKKIRKEERRRRREERRQRKEEKRSSKRKRKSKDADGSSSDMEKNENDVDAEKEKKYSSEEESESQKKRLEIELREKALESLRAKKGKSR